MAPPARRRLTPQPWQCPHCDHAAPVDSLLPEHIAREHPEHAHPEGDD